MTCADAACAACGLKLVAANMPQNHLHSTSGSSFNVVYGTCLNEVARVFRGSKDLAFACELGCLRS